jgi:hypothetical protein
MTTNMIPGPYSDVGLTKECNNCKYFTARAPSIPCDTCSSEYSKWEFQKQALVIRTALNNYTVRFWVDENCISLPADAANRVEAVQRALNELAVIDRISDVADVYKIEVVYEG